MVVKIKMPRGFDVDRLLRKIYPGARFFMWVFGMILASATVISLGDILTHSSFLMLLISLILFFVTGLIVWVSDIRLEAPFRSSILTKGTDMPEYIQWSGRLNSIDRITLSIIVCGFIGGIVWIWPGIPMLRTIEPDASIPYLLSAIAQSLAAVLALIFTISLIVAQLSSRYSYRIIPGFFDKRTIGHIVLFVVAILFPLLLLAIDKPGSELVKVSFILAAVCLLLLVPYFLHFRQKLKPEHIISELKDEVVRRLESKPDEEPESITAIDNIVMSAFVLKDYDTFNNGTETIANLTLTAYGRERNNIGGEFLARLKDIGIATIKDPRAPLQVLKVMHKISIGVIQNGKGMSQEIRKIADYVHDIASRAANDRIEDVANKAADILSNIGKEVLNSGMGQVARIIIEIIGDTGGKVAEVGMGGIVSQVADSLGSICTKAVHILSDENVNNTADNSIKEAAMQAIDSLGYVGAKAANEGLESAAKHVADILSNNASMPEEFARRTTYSLGENIGVNVIERNMNYAGSAVVYSLGAVSASAANKGFDDAASRAAFFLGGICTKAALKGMKEVTNQGINLLANNVRDIRDKTVMNKLMDTRVETFHALGNIGLQSVISGLGNSLKRTSDALIDLVTKAKDREVDLVAYWLVSFGAWAVFCHNSDFRRMAIQNLQHFEKTTGYKVMKVDSSKAKSLCLLYRINNYEDFLESDPGLFKDPQLEEAYKTILKCYQDESGQTELEA